jgi:hypothetical protein
MIRSMVAAALAGIGIGVAAGVVALCAWNWRTGGSADPRCALRLGNYTEHHEPTNNGDRITCRYVLAIDD